MGLLSYIRERRVRNAAQRNAAAAATLSQLGAVFGGSVNPLSVSPQTMLGVAAIFAAIRIRGESLANLPLRVVEIKDREKIPYNDPKLNELLSITPDGQITSVEFVQTIESQSCLTGAAYAHIERNIYGEPLRLVPIQPYEVSYWVDKYGQPDQHLSYNVYGQKVNCYDLIKIPFAGVYPYWQTARPQQLLSTPIALAQALDKESYNLFKNGCSTSGILQTDSKLSDNAWARLQKMLGGFRSGGVNSGGFLTLEEGLKFVSARMSNKDAEFVELKKQTIRDAAAIWGVPSYKLGDGEKSNYASQEEQNRDFWYSTILFRARLFENELTNKLIPPRLWGRVKIEFNFAGLLRGSQKDRAEFYTKMFNLGALSQNDICEMEGWRSLGAIGDKHYIQVNMTTLDKIQQGGAQDVQK